MMIAWVLGSGGLLGAALCRTLRDQGAQLYHPVERFCWDRTPELIPQMTAAVTAFSAQTVVSDRWEIYWAAGIGTMSSPEDVLAPETRAITLLFELLHANARLMDMPGAVAFASSAGAIYAASSDAVITELTPPTPTTAYAREKLKQEELVRSFVVENPKMSALVARISTLYGPGQANGKQQGLLVHIARCILRNRPIQIYVPYDTIRDYVAADDAANLMVTTLRANNKQARLLTKIIASEYPTTIAEIVSIFKRIARRAPQIVTSANRQSALYTRRIQFRSIVLPKCAGIPTKSLLIGIAQLMAAERAAFVRGAGVEAR